MADEITYINIEKLLEEHIEELQQMRGMIVQMALKTFGQENASINNKAKEMVASINQLKTIGANIKKSFEDMKKTLSL